MNYIRRLIIAVFIIAILSTAWYGAEMLLYGESQRSAVDLIIAVCIALSISGKIEKEAERHDQQRKFAEKFAEEITKYIKEGKAQNGGDHETEA